MQLDKQKDWNPISSSENHNSGQLIQKSKCIQKDCQKNLRETREGNEKMHYSLDNGSMLQSRVALQKSGQHLPSDSNRASLKK